MLQEFNYNTIEHREFLFKILKDPIVNNYLGNGSLIDIINGIDIQKYVLVINNIPIGIGFIIPIKGNEVEIRYCVLETHRGKGYASKLIKELLKLIPENTYVYASIQEENTASIRTITRCGFKSQDHFVYHKRV